MADQRGKGKTLWEMVTDWMARAQEKTHYNPLKARIGNAVVIDTVELREYNFFLYEIRETRRRVGTKEFLSADYVVMARPLQGEDIELRIRLNPASEREQKSGLPNNVLLLKLEDEFGYDENFFNMVNDPSGEFQVRENGQVVREYWRINDVRKPYKCKVAVVSDTDKNGKAEKSEVELLTLDYWDYWRETEDEAGQKVLDFLFVEMDNEDGWFEIWNGSEIDPRKVVVM